MKFLELLFPFLKHKHIWEDCGWIHEGKASPWKRRCIKCGRVEWLMYHQYGDIRYTWKDMTL